jgi:hypothetical protein
MDLGQGQDGSLLPSSAQHRATCGLMPLVLQTTSHSTETHSKTGGALPYGIVGVCCGCCFSRYLQQAAALVDAAVRMVQQQQQQRVQMTYKS